MRLKNNHVSKIMMVCNIYNTNMQRRKFSRLFFTVTSFWWTGFVTASLHRCQNEKG